MSITQFLFSHHGRIPRSDYWLKYVVPYFILYAITLFADGALGMLDPATGIGITSGIFSLLALYPSIVISIKRCHDRDRTGWFVLVAFIPLVNLWYLIEIMFLKGTTGSNKYGSDPLA
ncbi:MAG: DUF805 domain-containing protein [Proteobacteria bacterium]|nr:DUF805 domain-containing protein [Pseudomonadota bacterium]